MLKREYKYLVPNEMADQLRKEMEPFIELDKYASIRPQKEYTVRSIYYDTRNLDSYYEKLEGIKNRKKLRIRAYNEQGIANTIFLEIKCKIENFVDKYRAMLNYEDLYDLLSSGDLYSYIIRNNENAIENASRFFFHLNAKMLKPMSLVTYEREAFFSKFNSNFRITFDKNLRYSLFPSIDTLYREDVLRKAMKKYFVLEIKFHKGYLDYLHNIVRRFNLMRLSVSKYQICVNAGMNSGGSITNKCITFPNQILKEAHYCKEAI